MSEHTENTTIETILDNQTVETTETPSEFTFASFGLSPELEQALEKMNFTIPSPIQVKAIPRVMAGKDIIGQAQTGTGKTAAFAIPLIEKVDEDNDQVQAVVICPTRELAMQVAEEVRMLAKFKPKVSCVCVYGGQPIERQLMALKCKPQILIATPGRILDLIWRGNLMLTSVKTIVLDEADEMLNLGFRGDIEQIFDFIPGPRQTVLFSATMPLPILELTRTYQKNPEWIQIEAKQADTSKITQAYIEVTQRQKTKALTLLIDQYNLTLALVFCNTKHQVDTVTRHLQKEGYAAEGLHGGKLQTHRERILGRFRKGTIHILVATDVAARGIDVRNVQAVVNYDLPAEMESYTHRIGRTGRAGESGLAFALVSQHQVQQLRGLQKIHKNAIAQHILPGLGPVVFPPQIEAPPQAKKNPNSRNRNRNRNRNRPPKAAQQAL